MTNITSNTQSSLQELALKIKEQLKNGNASKFKVAVMISIAYDLARQEEMTQESFIKWVIDELGLSRNQAKRLKDFGTPFKGRVNLDDDNDPVIVNMSELAPCAFSLLMRFPTGAYEITDQGEVFVTLPEHGFDRTPLRDLTFRVLEALFKRITQRTSPRTSATNSRVQASVVGADYIVKEIDDRFIHAKNVRSEWLDEIDMDFPPRNEELACNPKDLAYYLEWAPQSGDLSGWFWNPFSKQWTRLQAEAIYDYGVESSLDQEDTTNVTYDEIDF